MKINMSNLSREIAKQLLQIKAIKLSPQNPFTWASGLRSPIYCDNRIVLSYPAVRRQVVKGLMETADSLGAYDTVAGVATAGIAHGALLAASKDLPFAYIRSKAKAHGRQNKIEGEIKNGAKVIVVEDLISTGGSSLQAVEALKEIDCTVVGVIAIFSYGFDKAAAAFAEAHCPFATITNYNILLEEAISANYIDTGQLATLQEWRKNPQEWSAAISS
jgi:orotate phosphoribosyltransferase